MGKGGGASASLADPSAAIASYQKGADVIEQQFPLAAQYFQQQLGSGWRQSIDSYTQAMNTGQPFSTTALDAMDELRGFLGMAPTSRTGEITNSLNSLSQKMATSGIWPREISSQFTDISNIMGNIDNLDGQDRIDAINNAKTTLNNTYNAVNSDMMKANQLASFIGQTASKYGVDPNTYSFKATDVKLATSGQNAYSAVSKTPGSQEVQDFYNQLKAQGGDTTGLLEHVLAGDIKPTEFTKIIAPAISDSLGTLKNTIEDIDVKIPLEKGKAPTGLEIQKKLEDLPEYQFQLQQGTQAMTRSQAARGELNSGNALIEATQFGQGLAQNVYQGHLSQLANLAGINMPMVQGQQQLQTGAGQAANNAALMYGQTGQQSIQDIARSRESAWVRSGDAQLQTALMNAQLKTQASMQNAASKSQGMAGIGQLAGSVLGMIL
jgi:hypothetical protein